ncbi:ABC transporter ATP-binding protein [Corynebacterium freneyi]|uniref:Fatty acid ABC transporter ATP-binding/permease protein n=1 Tax=Corynebacterium freneyi DNF00450 TaxID=1287475 RepID=A0A095Y0A3_9CORY|nr:ABC transporter ATP-binding protein [Corynebacterium freneyi]KGF15850.1 iron ABC transporter ATP-binding protein [Corynebacterium freneyi DNF00450]
MQYLARILGTTKVLWPFYVGIVVSSIGTAIAALVSPFLIRNATDAIVDAVGAGDPDTVARAVTTIIWLSIGLLVADLVQTIVHNIGGYLGDVMTARMREILSTRYFAKLLSLPQRYFDDQVTGTIIARLERSITNVTQFLQSFSNNFFPMLLTVFAVLGITGWHYWPLALLLAAVFPTYMWLTALTSKRWQKIESKKNARVDVAGGRFAEVVGQVKVVRSYTAETREVRDFAAHYDATVDLTREQSTWWHRMDALRGGILNVIFFGIYLLLFLRTLHGDFSIGTMVMLIQLVNMARQPATMMSFLVDSAQRAIAGSRDYFDVMALESEESAPKELIAAATTDGSAVSPAGSSSRESDRGASADGTAAAAPAMRLTPPDDGSPVIELDDVSFAYDEDNPVLRGVTFRAGRGEKVALVGESGGGKSTLVNLILGFYRPTGGTLSVCGADVRDVDMDELRNSIGVVFQDAALFSGTIRENIAYGRPDATDAEIEDAARRANADGFIRRFPDGYDTTIGERGLKLSGGQKQRVAIARAILKDAPVLLLDEATSALDTKAEREVQRGLEQLMEGRTTIIIAHRLSTISNVDTVVTLDRGRVDEVGSPAELAVSGGIYAELLKLTASASAADRKRLKKYGLEV